MTIPHMPQIFFLTLFVLSLIFISLKFPHWSRYLHYWQIHPFMSASATSQCHTLKATFLGLMMDEIPNIQLLMTEQGPHKQRTRIDTRKILIIFQFHSSTFSDLSYLLLLMLWVYIPYSRKWMKFSEWWRTQGLQSAWFCILALPYALG